MRSSEADRVLFEYHGYLVSLVDTSTHDLMQNYSFLMDYLDDIPYESSNKLDHSRIVDAYYLREKYDNNENHSSFYDVSDLLSDKEPSILEVFVALLTRYSDEVLTDPGDFSKAPEIFHDILRNIGALGCDNYHFSKEMADSFADSFLKKRVFLTENEKKMDIFMALGKFCIGEFC